MLLNSVRIACLAFAAASIATSQSFSPDLFRDLHWRNIGPFRGGRTRAATGVPGQAQSVLHGAGQRRRLEVGRLRPHLDADLRRPAPGSIGAIAVAPSDPNIIYVASGEGLQRPDLSVGDGIYKSTDAGKTWTHLGLRDGQQIPALAIDPRDANHLFAAVLGHPYGPNEERGVFAPPMAAQNWQKVALRRREHRRLRHRHGSRRIPMCSTRRCGNARQGPWEFGNEYSGTHGGIFKSTDGGKTWQKLTKGLPRCGAGLRGHRAQRFAPPLRHRRFRPRSGHLPLR